MVGHSRHLTDPWNQRVLILFFILSLVFQLQGTFNLAVAITSQYNNNIKDVEIPTAPLAKMRCESCCGSHLILGISMPFIEILMLRVITVIMTHVALGHRNVRNAVLLWRMANMKLLLMNIPINSCLLSLVCNAYSEYPLCVLYCTLK